MFKRLTLMLMFCFIALLSASEALTFHDLAKTNDQTNIRIRGFFYENPQGGWILAAEPNLKTCCIGNKMDKQIFIENLSFSPDGEQIVELEGVLSVHSLVDGQRQYSLSNVKQIKAEGNPSTQGISLIILLCLGGVSYTLFRAQKKNQL